MKRSLTALLCAALMLAASPLYAAPETQGDDDKLAPRENAVVKTIRKLDPNIFMAVEDGPITPEKQQQLVENITKHYPLTETDAVPRGLVLTLAPHKEQVTAIYYITQAGHAAYPGVIEKILYKTPGKEIVLFNLGWSGADEQAFSNWMEAANEDDEELKTRLSKPDAK